MSFIGECGRKARYPSAKVARRYAERAVEARGTPLRVYWCPTCNGFHLTKDRAEGPDAITSAPPKPEPEAPRCAACGYFLLPGQAKRLLGRDYHAKCRRTALFRDVEPGRRREVLRAWLTDPEVSEQDRRIAAMALERYGETAKETRP